MFKIEKDIPIPTQRTKPSSYPFADMQVGDSFFVPCPEGALMTKFVARVQSAVGAQRMRNPEFKFSVRRMQEGETLGVRVWRVQ